MKLKFNIDDKGTSYQVISINQNEADYDVCNTYETFSWTVFETVATALIEGKNVFIPKDLSKQIDITDIVIESVDPLQTAKNVAMLQIKDLIYNKRINKICIADIYTFAILNNWFIEKNIIITDENREAKYLEVINLVAEMTDTVLANQYIENLEALLAAKDNVDDAYGYYKALKRYLDQIESATTQDQITTIYNTVLSEYK